MDYQRVSCNVFDRYESLAVSRKIIKMKYLDEDQTSKEVQGFIKNIFSKDGAEFLQINNVNIRLDKIQSVEEL
jgi:transcriptional antiterminator Rof (Rho-off)